MGGKPRAFKDRLGPAQVRAIADALSAAAPGLDADGFAEAALPALRSLELRARVDHLVACLHDALPQPFPRAARTVLDAFAADRAGRLRGFAAWPLIDYLGAHGIDHPAVALDALRRTTAQFTGEFAIRPFLIVAPDATLTELVRWTEDPDEHVRRLASEGTRPLLPWGQRLQRFRADPTPVLALLERLKADPSEYVRRSVANNLNDIAKDHPRRVVAVCRRWLRGADEPRLRLIKRALRTLIKAGDRDALALLGYGFGAEVGVESLAVSPATVVEGDAIELSFRVVSTATRAQPLVVDYAVHYVKANGARRPKVFKLRSLTLAPGQSIELRKRHSFAPVSTRAHYPGTHEVEILINGVSTGRAAFELAD